MTLDDEVITDMRQEFCRALKTARERSGITLDAIASTTKIPAGLFDALERGDLRHWPNGLFRRSYFRDYARMIGLPIAEACEAFIRLFPDQAAAAEAAAAPLPPPRRHFLIDALMKGVRIRLRL
jgi:cytoskeletal protein RodZ